MEAQTKPQATLARITSPGKHQHPRKLQKTRSWDRVIVYDADSGDVDIRRKGEVDKGTAMTKHFVIMLIHLQKIPVIRN